MAKHNVEFPLENYSLTEYLALVAKASEALGWTVIFVSETGIQAESPMSIKKNTWGEEITITHFNGFIKAESKSKGNTLIDFGRNRKNIEALLSKIDELAREGTGEGLEKWREAIVQNQAQGEDDLLNPASAAAKDAKKWWSVFIPTKEFFVTPLLIDLNILLFLAMVISSGSFGTLLSPDSGTLITWGAIYKPLIIEGEWWRLFTAMFEHIGLMHLLFNMYASLFIGIYLEPLMGKLLFTVAYLVTGIAASVTSAWWHDNSVGAGASGAIFGLYGVFLLLLLTNLIDQQTRKSLLSSIGIFVGYNLILGLRAGVDNAAHIGGLVAGVVCGAVIYLHLKDRSNKTLEKIIAAGLVVAVAVAVVFTIPKLSNPVGEYQAMLINFDKYETTALSVYKEKEAPDSSDLVALKTITLPNYLQCKAEVKKIKAIKNLPAELLPRVSLLDEYTDARIRETELKIRAIEDPSGDYITNITEVVEKIRSLIKKLNG